MNLFLCYALCAVWGYLLGCLNPAHLLARRKGFDIRERGSKGSGASNALITMGWRAGVLVAVADMGKALCAVLLARRLFPALPMAAAVAGAACVLGHIFPFYLHFRGGKGFAPFLGVVLALDWKFWLVILCAILLITWLTDYIVLGTLTTVVAFPLWSIAMGRFWVAAILSVVSAVMIAKHMVNLRRICAGTEIGLRKARKADAPRETPYSPK
ncbi:MAG: glycerol-3-phosphate acyltransferase [Oscillibacter sp.]